MNKIELLGKIAKAEMDVFSAIGTIVLAPEKYNEGFEKVREAFRELKEMVRKED